MTNSCGEVANLMQQFSVRIKVQNNDWGKPTANSISADGFPLMAGPNFQPSDGNPIVISILRQLVDEPENVPEM